MWGLEKWSASQYNGAGSDGYFSSDRVKAGSDLKTDDGGTVIDAPVVLRPRRTIVVHTSHFYTNYGQPKLM